MPEEVPIERLIQENLGLIESVVTQILQEFPILPAGYNRDDLESLGSMALIQAAQTFDPTQGVLFSTYAARCIENKISSALTRAQQRQLDARSPEIRIDEAEAVSPEAPIAGEGAGEQDMDTESQEALREAVQWLPAPYDQIMRRLYVDEQSMADVAREMGLSPPRVMFLHNRALRMLRRHRQGLPPAEE